MTTVFEIFGTYGWTGLLGILGAGLIYLSILYFSKKISKNVSSGLEKIGEKLTNQLSDQNTTLMNCIVDQQKSLVDHLINQEAQKEQNHNNMVNERMLLAEDINNSLKDILHIHHADRVLILEFHNSYQNLSGVPFAKYSCNFEKFEQGLKPLTNKIQGLPFSSISSIVSDLLKSKSNQVLYTNIDQLINSNPILYSLIKNENTKSILYNALYDKNNVLIGLLVLEFNHKVTSKNLNLSQLSVQAVELTSILNIRYKYIK